MELLIANYIFFLQKWKSAMKRWYQEATPRNWRTFDYCRIIFFAEIHKYGYKKIYVKENLHQYDRSIILKFEKTDMSGCPKKYCKEIQF